MRDNYNRRPPAHHAHHLCRGGPSPVVARVALRPGLPPCHPRPDHLTAADRAVRLPYESGLAAVARHEVHIERVWPMRSPSTGSLEASSSAYFLVERRGTPPATIVPVEGLRMNQAFSLTSRS
jgi:hypothetical protein